MYPLCTVPTRVCTTCAPYPPGYEGCGIYHPGYEGCGIYHPGMGRMCTITTRVWENVHYYHPGNRGIRAYTTRGNRGIRAYTTRVYIGSCTPPGYIGSCTPPWVYLSHDCTGVHAQQCAPCPVKEPWAQVKRNPWVRGSCPSQDPKSVREGVPLRAGSFRSDRKKVRTIG